METRWTARVGAWMARVWFEPMPATRLAALRVVFCGYAAWLLFDRHHGYVAAASAGRSQFAPLGTARILSSPLSTDDFALCLWGAAALAGLATLGVLYRLVGPACALALLFVLSYRNSWGMNYHTLNTLVLAVGVLALAPAHHAWSVDAAVARRWPTLAPMLMGRRGMASRSSHARYGWPVRLISFAIGLTYMVAGVAKLMAGAGWAWVLGENLRNQVAYNALAYELLSNGADPLVWSLYPATTLFAVLATGSLFVELVAPLAAWHRPLGRLWALSAFSMHWGIYWIMGIDFPLQLWGIAFVSFFPIERLAPQANLAVAALLRLPARIGLSTSNASPS